MKKLNKRILKKILEQDTDRIDKIRKEIAYENELIELQIELLKLQQHIQSKGIRLLVIFEGRDAAGKGGTIRRCTQHLNPRGFRVVALPKPTELERGQWYFQRYIHHLPNPGEIVFFDRSWYNRAVVEPVNGFCSEEQYALFMEQVVGFENMLISDNVYIIKFWLDIEKEEQAERFADRRESPLKRWKLSPVDEKAQRLWDDYSFYRDAMFRKTGTSKSPWICIDANKKKAARINAIRYILQQFDYQQRQKVQAQFPYQTKITTYDS